MTANSVSGDTKNQFRSAGNIARNGWDQGYQGPNFSELATSTDGTVNTALTAKEAPKFRHS
jgi:hypothetical protein